jgi:alcohol dehydrogenase
LDTVRGLLTVVAAREAGARRIILAGAPGDEERLALGRALGADDILDVGAGDPLARLWTLNRGRLATRVIEATGNARAVELGLDLLTPGGVITIAGGHQPESRVALKIGALVGQQFDIRGTQLGANQYEACLAVLTAGKYPFERLVTYHFPLGDIQDAVLTFERRGACIKTVITFD